ncbi:MAG TPA: valine--tRNA ligase [Flavitalea sp.]|nr:valine--tRNA ligase [Flavitalea sp.]
MELSKNYDPKPIEDKWSAHWKQKGYFNSKPDARKPFTVVIPPPNVTGVLHMGHTLNETVQDILVRHARMHGFNTCWVPGSDHASIATEAKVVEMLKREKRIEKSQLTREEFLKYAFEWKEKYGNIIYHQIDKLGCSVDWSRVTFTMDPHYYKAVIRVFIDLYGKGLIYRGARMIHWDPSAKTALSDEEVEYRDMEGAMYHIRYQVADGENETKEYITIATQRPETIMGDTALCVNPGDKRYQHLKGKSVIVPLVNRKVPVIFDEYVDMSFGTGALKITPAHDINDYNLGLKHHLPIINTLNENGTLSDEAGICVGMDRFAAREKVIELLKEAGLFVKEVPHSSRLGFSQRTNAVVEPRISTQWFVAMKSLAEKALHAVASADIIIHPEGRFDNTYRYWMENVKDWCISRQLWWGQRIPAWYDADGKMVVAATEDEAKQEMQKVNGNISTLRQDDDVLDTWFSSWLWPMEVFKGISDPGNDDFKYYYPTAVLVTGQDIIFFWVARMIMAGLEYKDEKPFTDVYFTGMVRDKLGRKMSKQLGNSPDLLNLIDRYGADAVRFGILISSPAGNDLLFDDASPEQGRNFNNKLWNALKLVKLWEAKRATGIGNGRGTIPGEFAIRWFEQKLNEAKTLVESLYISFRLSEALKLIYSLIWDDFCSWYLEWVKPATDEPIDANVYNRTVEFFTELVHLLHPFMPFITEEIYHQLMENRSDDLCIRQQRPAASVESQLITDGNLLRDLITTLRDVKIKNRIKPKEPCTLYIQTDNENKFQALLPILKKQTNLTDIIFTSAPQPDSISVVSGTDKYYLTTVQPINSDNQRNALKKEIDYLRGFLQSVNKKLTNERFIQQAKAEVISLEQRKKEDAENKIRVLEESLREIR